VNGAPRSTIAWRRGATWAVGAALVAAAWGVAAITPPDGAEESPFVVSAEVGERATGRNIAVTVHDVTRSESVRSGDWSADGNWIVVDLDAEAVVSEFGALLELATLEVNGRTFGASERPDSLLRAPLAVGVPVSGSLAFELPADVDGGAAVLSLGETADPRLDSVVEIDLVLDALVVEDAVELVPVEFAASGRRTP
jgi:hypothetical protein